jgi:hypothetical protein
MDYRNLIPEVIKCVSDRIEGGDLDAGDTCDACEHCMTFDVRGPEGFGKIGSASYCELKLWADET